MESITRLQSQMTVDEVLSNWKDTHAAFANLKTKCVGCFMQRFCTLQDVSEIYQIPLQELAGELEKYIPDPIIYKGASHE